MPQKHKKASHFRKSRAVPQNSWNRSQPSNAPSTKPRLELVVKCDSTGSLEAVAASIAEIIFHEIDICLISSRVGDINMSDVVMAETGSRLIVGYQVEVLPGIDRLAGECGVEVRLYDVIYKLTDDIRNIAESLIPRAVKEQITGSARVIELFKSTRKGIIVGCEVSGGYLAVGQRFRIISGAGIIYIGNIESMHKEQYVVQKAVPGQQVGIKIKDFKKAKIGDLVESFRPLPAQHKPIWRPSGRIIRKDSK
jgi:translation initiation factor IF-2